MRGLAGPGRGSGVAGFGIVLVAAALLAGCGSGGSGSRQAAPTPTPTATTTPTAANPDILPPATTPSVPGICDQPISYGVDGGTGNDLCSDGAVNVVAWNYYRKGYATILTLGEYASPQQVRSLLNTFGPVTPDVTCEVYDLAYAYYGWQWSVPISVDGITC